VASPQADFYSVAFSPDGNALAAGSADGNIRIWDLRAPDAAPTVLSGHEDYVCSVAFSPDGRTLASASGDNSIRLWDLGHPQAAPQVLAGHSANVLTVVFSPDGKRLASGGEDRTIRLWDAHEPKALSLALTDRRGMVLSVAFSPDGRSLASAGDDGTTRLWKQSALLADTECHLVWRNLSMDEWRLFLGDGIPYERTCPNLPSGAGALADAPAASMGPTWQR
jgi:WD40 repeat protein